MFKEMKTFDDIDTVGGCGIFDDYGVENSSILEVSGSDLMRAFNGFDESETKIDYDDAFLQRFINLTDHFLTA